MAGSTTGSGTAVTAASTPTTHRTVVLVDVSAARHCFVGLPKAYTAGIFSVPGPHVWKRKGCFKLEWTDAGQLKRAFVSWIGGVSRDNSIAVPIELVRSVSLPTNGAIAVSYVPKCPELKVLEVKPATAQDWDIIQAQASLIQQTLLSQVDIVALEQPIPCWVGASIVRFQVVSGLSSECARLLPDTELRVCPPPPPASDATNSTPITTVHLQVQPPYSGWPGCSNMALVHPSIFQKLRGPYQSGVVILCSIEVLCMADVESCCPVQAKAEVLKPAGSDSKAAPEPEPARKAIPVLLGMDDRVKVDGIVLAVPFGTVATWASIVMVQHPPVPSIVWSSEGKDADPDLSELRVRPVVWPCTSTCSTSFLASALKRLLAAAPEVPVCDGTLLCVPHGTDVPATIPHADAIIAAQNGLRTVLPVTIVRVCIAGELGYRSGNKVHYLLKDVVPSAPISVGSPVKVEVPVNHFFCGMPWIGLGGPVRATADAVWATLAPALHSADSRGRAAALSIPLARCCLVTGGRGCGKSTVLQAVASRSRCDPSSAFYTVWLDCTKLRGLSMTALKSQLASKLKLARYGGTAGAEWGVSWGACRQCAPCLVLLDDIDTVAASEDASANEGASISDVLVEFVVEQQEQFLRRSALLAAQTAVYATTGEHGQVAQILGNTSTVLFVASAKSAGAVHPSLRRPGLFDAVIDMKPGGAAERAELLQAIMMFQEPSCAMRELTPVAHLQELDWADIASRADGFAPADLRALVVRAQACASVRGVCSVAELKQSDFEQALEGFVPASLASASLFKSSVRWSHVGGLLSVRQELRAALEVPLRFARLFATAPIRMPAGLLLYGPPGCGKTLLAGAVANECGLRFISVKGPEILDKYIGASEQAIRDLFGRAAAAAPSVLFFDEFDSIACQRGSASTGVTDRVVNQLLTFLDGVEDRKGVFVLAATSRPDLLDAALLRPGRLDKALLCDFPTAAERADILLCLANRMHVSDEVRAALPLVATCAACENYSGADLQAVMNSAQLEAVHARLNSGTAATGAVVIELSHLSAALAASRPSTSVKERARYDHLYATFRGGAPSAEHAVPTRNRVALA